MISRLRAKAESASRRQAVEDSLPVGVRIAAAWSWRILVIAGVVALVLFLVSELRYLVIPVLVSLLLAALLVPLVGWLQRHRWPKWLAVTVAEVGLIGAVTGLVYLIVTQIQSGFPLLRDRTLAAYQELKAWLLASPFEVTEKELNDWVAGIIDAVQRDTQALVSGAVTVGSGLGHFLTGLLLALFATLFFLIDGRRIWAWVVGVFPRRARRPLHGAGEAGWHTLSGFVRVQILVAFVDAVGIALGAWILGLFYGGFPLVIPIGIAVFLGSFIPVVGAVLTGALAVFVALVSFGPVPAFIMLAIVLLVQQVEGHVLQPFVMGVAVRIHPLAVVFAVATGGFVAGIPGALFAVPVVAVANTMVRYLADGRWRGEEIQGV